MESLTIENQSYLTFRLGEELFATSVNHVLEILEPPKITKVPRSPDFMPGVINLRGNVLPIIDASLKFGFEKSKPTINTCILVLTFEYDDQHITLGALVDEVVEVMEIDAAEIQPPPSIGSKYKTEFIEGMVKVNDQFHMILNMSLVFSSHEVTLLEEASQENSSNA